VAEGGTKTDPAFYYRQLSVLFINFASALRGLSHEDYITGYNAGLFSRSGEELFSAEKLSPRELRLPMIQLARMHGEPVLKKLWLLGEAEELLFGDHADHPRS
jgi:hypothetical protein